MIGFMQGRFSALVNGKIQAFPWMDWSQEFCLAEKYGFHLMEWTLDQEDLYKNPLMTVDGQREIRALVERHNVAIQSLTGDCFMQAPFWKDNSTNSEQLKKDFCSIVDACAVLGIKMIVIPLVDQGRLEDGKQEDALVNFLDRQTESLMKKDVKIIFESDFAPSEFSRFIERLHQGVFGVNYDTGNSASLGFEIGRAHV